MTAENAAQAFYIGELEQELRRLNRTDYVFKSDGDREKCFEMIESVRRENVYPHPESECSPGCKARGMRYVCDELDKLLAAVFMQAVETSGSLMGCGN